MSFLIHRVDSTLFVFYVSPPGPYLYLSSILYPCVLRPILFLFRPKPFRFSFFETENRDIHPPSFLLEFRYTPRSFLFQRPFSLLFSLPFEGSWCSRPLRNTPVLLSGLQLLRPILSVTYGLEGQGFLWRKVGLGGDHQADDLRESGIPDTTLHPSPLTFHEIDNYITPDSYLRPC